MSNKKSKVMRINGKSTEPVTVNGQNLDETSKFTYLGGVVTTQGGGGDDITCRIGKARTAFRKVEQNMEILQLFNHDQSPLVQLIG